MMDQSPIFVKTYDFILWMLDHTEHYPKSERFRMAKRVEDTAIYFHKLLVKAARSRYPYPILCEAVLELEELRLLMRLANARRLSTQKQYLYASERLVEVGKLLGGWMNAVKETKV